VYCVIVLYPRQAKEHPFVWAAQTFNVNKNNEGLDKSKGGSAMANETLTHRLARRDDLEALKALMDAAISENQKAFLDESQIASSRAIMGLDTQLIDDGTYFIVQVNGELAGCGGWSRRATMYGGDQTPGRSAALLDPTKDAARIRAMYTHPNHTRKGIGRLIISLCEEAAKAEGFTKWNWWQPCQESHSIAHAGLSRTKKSLMTAAVPECRSCA
jgi:GNAT superfamily N-acetyltransferase